MNVYIPGKGFATQGPCADGYHVPTYDDWIGLRTIMQNMGISSSDSKIMLHLPYTGFRDATSGNISSQGTAIRYWSSTHYNTGSQDSAYYFANYLIGSAVKCNGFSIRPFKDEFVTPDLDWTVVSGTLGSAGIFRNQTEGIISITGNGTTGYTIADKNCGATTVWSDGDTLGESNCGKYYQWGNNYGFPFTGSITTSSTQIDASNYGPGNYYSSSTFITNSANPQIWDTSYNKNLRGGENGNVQVVNELKNAYIGNFNPKDLLSNIIAYYPMQGNLNDESGNGYNLSKLAGSYSGTTYNTLTDFAAVNTSLTYNTTSSSTISTWYNKGNSSNSDTILFSLGDDITIPVTSGYGWGFMIFPTTSHAVINGNDYCPTAISLMSGWHMYSSVFDYNNKTLKFYVDGVLSSTLSSLSSGGLRGGTRCCIGTVKSGNSFPQSQTVTGYQGITFATQNAMSANDLLAFYNASKSLYGL